MEAIRIIQKREDGHLKLDIVLPADEPAEEFEVIVRPLHEQKRQDLPDNKPSSYEIAQRFKGSMKNSGYQVDKYDVYDQ